MKIIAIAAVTAGGKTSAVKSLVEKIPNATSLHFDDYSFEEIGFCSIIVINTNNVILSGNMRYDRLFDMYGASFSMAEGDMERSLYYMTELRNHLTKENKPGIEYTDVMTAMLYDMLMSKYKDMYGDKLMELTIDDKKYITLSMEDWNIEKPLMGWWKEMDGDKNWLYYCCDDGKVYDELHGEMDMSFYCDKDGIKLEDTANMRLISVTPERRQQLVEAYRKYMKKAKKNK